MYHIADFEDGGVAGVGDIIGVPGIIQRDSAAQVGKVTTAIQLYVLHRVETAVHAMHLINVVVDRDIVVIYVLDIHPALTLNLATLEDVMAVIVHVQMDSREVAV